jgi:hypothetical protein
MLSRFAMLTHIDCNSVGHQLLPDISPNARSTIACTEDRPYSVNAYLRPTRKRFPFVSMRH